LLAKIRDLGIPILLVARLNPAEGNQFHVKENKMSNASTTLKNKNRNSDQQENVSSPRRVFRWMKIILILALILFIVFGSLNVTGKLLTSRLETETETHAFES
jgi:hypothetical protein